MLLKATVKCSCGCAYEIISNISHDSISCPNCNKQFSDSDKLAEILRIYDSMEFADKNADNESLKIETLTLLEVLPYLK